MTAISKRFIEYFDDVKYNINSMFLSRRYSKLSGSGQCCNKNVLTCLLLQCILTLQVFVVAEHLSVLLIELSTSPGPRTSPWTCPPSPASPSCRTFQALSTWKLFRTRHTPGNEENKIRTIIRE